MHCTLYSVVEVNIEEKKWLIKLRKSAINLPLYNIYLQLPHCHPHLSYITLFRKYVCTMYTVHMVCAALMCIRDSNNNNNV